ncbi:hypothetical protein LUZ60_010087 [Juncus effusus]|nr:hypothetical protein LUZ60_010087 [Juncus effusus]
MAPPPDLLPPPPKRHRSDDPPTAANDSPLLAVDGVTTSSSESSSQINHTPVLDIRPIREVPFLPASWQPVIGPNKKESPVVVFAHGGGAPSTSIWMLKWKELIREALNAAEVVTFDYPYVLAKRKTPPKAEKLVEHHLEIVKDVCAKYPGHPLVLMGKSLGSRVSCMISGADGINVSAIVCFGYPLKGTHGELRDKDLLQLQTPTLFVQVIIDYFLSFFSTNFNNCTIIQLFQLQGSNDCHCPLETLESVRRKMRCENEVYVINGGDHSFQIGKKVLESSGMSQDQAERNAANVVAHFVGRSIC